MTMKGASSLMDAIKEGDEKRVKDLLNGGGINVNKLAKVSDEEAMEEMPLSLAVSIPVPNPSIILSLLQHGAKVGISDVENIMDRLFFLEKNIKKEKIDSLLLLGSFEALLKRFNERDKEEKESLDVDTYYLLLMKADSLSTASFSILLNTIKIDMKEEELENIMKLLLEGIENKENKEMLEKRFRSKKSTLSCK